MVRCGRLRSGVKPKLKRWRKGQSSESNPETHRFREAARSRFFSKPAGKSDLTVDVLKLHNELQSNSLSFGPRETSAEEPLAECEEGALTEKTSGTFLSGLSDCSNLTFSRVQRLWESNSADHKEICAVLAAVTEVIRSQGGNETETEYFAALMTTMEAVESEESFAAVAYLLNLVMKRVPGPVLIKKFSDTAKVFMNLLAAQTGSGSTAALRWILSCLSTLLRKQDLAVWSFPSTLQVYHGLLSFTVHVKPKVRKEAHRGICSVLKGSDFMFGDSAPPHHPAAQSTARFCIKEIEESGGSDEGTTTLHVLGLLKDVLPCFPVSCVKSCCEILLRVMTLSHVMVTACAMQAFHGLFVAKPNPAALTAELNAQIITALYDYLPNVSDLQPSMAWLTTMEKAHINLCRLQDSLCLAHLPRLFSTAISCLLSPHSQLMAAAADTMKVLLRECVAPFATDIGVFVSSSPSGHASHICKMFRAVEDGLAYRFYSSWAFVLQVLGTFFEVIGAQAYPVMKQCLQALSDLRETPHFPHTGELERAVGMAVESMGPEAVLQAIPLQIDGTEERFDFPRSWLIPVIRDHVKHTQLTFFNKYFLPLAANLKNRALELAQSGHPLEAKIYDTLQWQIWTLLPGFCTKPTDTVVAFKGIARTLGTAISDRPDLRLTICQALRTLVSKGCENEADRAEVSRFAKNFLPILFNVYSMEPTSGESTAYRLPVLDTIKVYLTLADQQLVCGFLDKASEKLKNLESSEFTRLSVMDLIVAMAPKVTEPSMNNIYQTIIPFLQSKDHRTQKKAYRILEEICGGEKEPCRLFVHKHLEELKQTLLDSLKSAASPAKRPRLKCLIHIVKQLSVEHQEFIVALLPEVIICMKEVSIGARRNGYTLLVEIGQAFLRFYEDTREAVSQYLALIYAGLTGSVTMISCTVLALTRLVFEFKDKMDMVSIEQLLQNICLLLQSKTRDVVKSALSFIKVVLFIMDTRVLAQHLQALMESIGSMRDDMRRHFRVKLKNIFTKFIRKFGFEMIDSMVPEEYHRVLVNIRKAEARNKRHRALKRGVRDSDSEDETPNWNGDSIEEILAETDSEDERYEKGEKATKNRMTHKNRAWLKEGEEDDPLNFLDQKVAQRVLATKPELRKKANIKHDFPVTSDGRLVISQEAKDKQMNGSEDEANEILEEIGVKTKPVKKRKFQSADDDVMQTDSCYKAGGSGIHRSTLTKKNKEHGAEYKSLKGRGDVKLRGKPDPFAYVPLNKSQLNRRKKAKICGQFKGLVKAAQRGAGAGRRLQRKKRTV
ncbi:RRP12-like protein [Carcharodon carcharias]|uniref:RRP12-like protein n=1 Tax=Carcharodon carcharias TaxID=13397 RepID=UPI001B7D92F7|nr:RRP12-like protein [Carcharodon carcharias]